jgi:hypothetical protein
MQRSRAFLLRCWREGQITVDEATCWRFIVEEVGEGQARHGFATLELLLAFLCREFAEEQDKAEQKKQCGENPIG